MDRRQGFKVTVTSHITSASIRHFLSHQGDNMEEEGEISAQLAAQRSQKELDDEIKKRKERQVDIDLPKDI